MQSYFTASHELHDQTVRALIVIDLVQFHDIWVVHSLQNVYLILQGQLVLLIQLIST